MIIIQGLPFLDFLIVFNPDHLLLFFIVALLSGAGIIALVMWVHEIRRARELFLKLPDTPSIPVRLHETLLIGGKGCHFELPDVADGIALAMLRWHGGTTLEIIPITGSLHIDRTPRVRDCATYRLGQLLRFRYGQETFSTRIVSASQGDRS